MYEIEELRSPPSTLIIEEISAFLAAFVRRGQLAHPLAGDAEERRWATRMDWWWLSNPFCTPDSPLAIILREQGGRIAGFAGFIPHDYQIEGRAVPGLMSTTFFVSEEHRGKAMSIILRAERYARDYHLVDGSPNDAMQRILERLKYRQFSLETQYLYVIRRAGLAPRAVASRIGSALLRQRSRAAFRHSVRVIREPREVESVPAHRDNKLRRRVTPESLSWLMASGTEPKRLIAVCGPDASLMAYGMGVIKMTRGLKVLQMQDYSSFNASAPLDAVFSYAATEPDAFGLSDAVDLIAWPTLNGHEGGAGFLKVRRPAELYYKVPSTWEYSEKVGVPGDGDTPLL